jgi:NadR type nicotinamide-nucleotide adenylyltransferase
VIIGPECTGKSALSEFLADQFNTVWVPEFARGYLDNLPRPYERFDLANIARGQLRIEDEWGKGAKDVLFCDTNLYVIKVWSEFKYGDCDKEILESIATRKYDLYLLTYIDIPWEEDPLREHPDKREALYQMYLREMQNQSVPFVEIKGEREARRKTAVDTVNTILLRK